jgi:hypothetical protein
MDGGINEKKKNNCQKIKLLSFFDSLPPLLSLLSFFSFASTEMPSSHTVRPTNMYSPPRVSVSGAPRSMIVINLTVLVPDVGEHKASDGQPHGPQQDDEAQVHLPLVYVRAVILSQAQQGTALTVWENLEVAPKTGGGATLYVCRWCKRKTLLKSVRSQTK